jgi:molybdate transport system regulatory protein
MRLSIRNQLAGVVDSVARGEVMGTVRTRLAGGPEVVSAITLDAIDELQLAEGRQVTVLLKSTEVSIATGAVGGLSIRNRIPGTIEHVDLGAVMTTVRVAIAGGQTVTAAITKDAAEDLDLGVGGAVTVLVKATDASIAVD